VSKNDKGRPTDAEMADSMLRWAEVFRATTAELTGVQLGWTEADARRLDELADQYVATSPPEDARQSLVLSLGAYLGELIVRNGKARWCYDEGQQAPAIENVEGRGFPHNKVVKRLNGGAEHRLWPFYAYLVRGELTDGTALKPFKETRPTSADPEPRRSSVPTEVQRVLSSAVYRAVRASLARKILDDPRLAGRVRLNDDPDGPLVVRTDDAAASGDAPRWYEVATEEVWPYLVEKHTPRYGRGSGIIMTLPPAI
jgi:hypothetical protein